MINNLEWDSDFFNLKIGKTDTYFDIDTYKKEFNLIYCFAKYNDFKINEFYKNIGAQIVDQKVVFHKDTPNYIEATPKNSIIEVKLEAFDELKSLAYQSGEYSRFFIDKNLPENSFEKLYSIWLKKSLSREIADKVYVNKQNEKIKGFITLGIKGRNTNIGLISVDKKSRGLGIGKSLINCSNTHALKNKSKCIEVFTQKQNKNACTFYMKNGFSEGETINIYHYWTNK